MRLDFEGGGVRATRPLSDLAKLTQTGASRSRGNRGPGRALACLLDPFLSVSVKSLEMTSAAGASGAKAPETTVRLVGTAKLAGVVPVMKIDRKTRVDGMASVVSDDGPGTGYLTFAAGLLSSPVRAKAHARLWPHDAPVDMKTWPKNASTHLQITTRADLNLKPGRVETVENRAARVKVMTPNGRGVYFVEGSHSLENVGAAVTP